MPTPTIRDFYRSSVRHDGELRADPKKGGLKLERYRGGFAGRTVRWLKTKLSSKSHLVARQAANTSATLSFLQAMKSYYGSGATQTILEQGQIDILKPLKSRTVRDIIKNLNKEQMTHMENLLKSGNTHPERGFELLVNLASRNMLDSQGARNILASQKFPKGSPVDCAIKALKDGVQLSQNSMLAIYSAMGAARDNGGAQDLYTTLRDNHLLNDPNVAKLFSYMPSGIKDEKCAQLYDLIGSGFFAQLRTPAPKALKMEAGVAKFSHTTAQLPHTKTHNQLERDITNIALQQHRGSVIGGHVKPFIQEDGTLDAKGFLKNLPPHTQFGKDFKSSMAGNSEYRINGKTFQNDPEGALQELWSLSKGEVKLFTSVCNLLSDEVWVPLSSKSIIAQAGGRDELAFNPAKGQGEAQAFYEIAQGKKGWLDVRRTETQSLNQGQLTMSQGKKSTTLTLDNKASFLGERSLRALVRLNDVSLLRMKSQARFAGPLKGFQVG